MKISIVTVCRNSERTIGRALESLYQHHCAGVALENLVIDGASEDGTMNIVCAYAEKMPLRWVSELDDGIYDAMNKGLAMARGDVISILNSDDWLLPNTLQRVIDTFNHHEIDYLYGTVERWEREKMVGLNRPLPRELWEREIWWQMPIPHISLFAKRELYERVGHFDPSYKIGGDHDWMVRLHKSGAVGLELPEPPLAAVELGGVGGRWQRFGELYRCARAHGQPFGRTSWKVGRFMAVQLLHDFLPRPLYKRVLKRKGGRFS